ncbi:MAG TPA: GAF domain-containing protein [Candidatus Dormibacteraeota bacterium]
MQSPTVQHSAGGPVLQALHDISVLAADGRQDPAAVAALAAEHASRLLDAEAAAVFEWDERQELLIPVYESPSAAREAPMRRGEGMAGTVFQFQQPMNVADYQALDIALPASAERGMRGALAVPMVVAGRPIGVLGVWTYQVRHFSEEEVQLLVVFAANIAPAFEASRIGAQRAAQAENLRSLQEVAVAVTSVHEPGAIAEMAAAKACEMVGGDGADICWWDEEADLLVALSSHRRAPTFEFRPWAASEGVIGLAFRQREPILEPDYQASPNALPWAREGGVQTLLAVPLVVRDQALGVLGVHSRQARAFDSEQVELLTLLASLITPALEAAHLLESRELQVRGLTALHEVAVAAGGILDAQTLGRLTVDRATDLLGVDSAVLRWWDERSGCLRLLASNDPHPEQHKVEITPQQGVIGRAFREGRTVTIGDYRHSESSLPWVANDGVMTAMGVPLTVGQRTVGALAVASYKPHRYDALQARLLNLFAAQVAPALEAARLASERERHHQVMRTLQQLGAAAGGLFDFEVIARMAIDAAVELLGASSAGIGWWEPDQEVLAAVDHLAGKPSVSRIAPGEGAVGQVFATGSTVVVPDYPEWEHRLEWSVRMGHKSILAVPLVAGDRTVGAMVARFMERREFDGDEIQVLTLLAAQVAPILEAARLHADLAGSERRLRALHETMACSVVVHDGSGAIVDINDAGLRMFGIERSQLDGRMPADIAGFERITEEGSGMAWDQRPMAVCLRTRRPVRNQVVGYRRPDGHEFWLQFDCVPVLDERGRVEQVIATSIDITSVKVAEVVRRESEAKSRFLASMSHELRTPLNSILGFAQLLEGEAYGELNDRQRRYLAHIGSSGRHLLELVNDVLDLSKVAAGQMELVIENVPLKHVIGEVIDRLRPMADARRLRVTAEVPPGMAVRADVRRLEQVLANLVSNAIKFTPEDGTVEITVKRKRQLVQVSVRDTGIGIPLDQHERIFMEFTQVDDSRSRRHDGTGLGLPLSRRLVELMGGRIWVKSDPGGGSEFSFTLPAM